MSIEWGAGIFEGEGCIRTFDFTNYSYEVKIKMTDLDVLQKMQDIFGGSICTTKKYKPHHKDSWIWRITGKTRVRKFLELCMPYFGFRRSYHAQNLLDIIDRR